MKTEQLIKMQKTAEVIAVYGKKDNTTAKRYVKLQAALETINANNNVDSIVRGTLDYYRPFINTLSRDVRGYAKNEFCKVCSIAIAEFGTLYFLNIDGTINAPRVWSKVKPSYNKDLFVILTNLLQDAGVKGERVAIERENNEKFEAYLSALNDELADYSIPAIIAA